MLLLYLGRDRDLLITLGTPLNLLGTYTMPPDIDDIENSRNHRHFQGSVYPWILKLYKDLPGQW